MGDTPKPEKPTTAMRIVLGAAVTAFAWFTAVPVILVLAILFTLGLFCGAAVTLEHVGALDSPVLFRVAHWSAVLPLVIFFVAAYAHRLLKRDAKGRLAIVLRWPVLTACLALPFVTLLVLRLAWDTTLVSPVAGALVLADLYFFSAAALAGMLYVAVVASRAVYSWAAAGKFRARVVSGALAGPLVLLFAFGYRSTPATDDRSTRKVWADRIEPARTPDVLETERQLFVLIDQGLGDAHAAVPAVAPAPVTIAPPPPPSLATAPLFAPLPTATATTAAPCACPDDIVTACMTELTTPQLGGKSQVDQVRSRVQSAYGFSAGDAHDIVNDALFSVCEAHARKPYRKLGAVLQKAGDRRAWKWRSRSRRSCPLETAPPRCTPSTDELVRFEGEDDIINAALCQEDDVTQDIIYRRAIDWEDFPAIGAANGLTGDQARSKFFNARDRLRKRLAACGP